VARIFVANFPPTDSATTTVLGSFPKKALSSILWQNHASLGILSLLKEKKIFLFLFFKLCCSFIAVRTEILV
jgi:hypothetical protein